jgi:pyruvate dehydrogenase E2 component (dihydrolipoamide acetyltransferase)
VQAADVSTAAQITSVSSVDGRQAEIVELTGIRRTIADRMQMSFQTLPHIALTIEADVTALENARAHLNRLAQKRDEGKISMTALLVRIVAWGLERHPYLNASLIDGKIYLWRDVNIGVATALESGLIVPVVQSANRRPVRQIADALQDLTVRARAGELGLRDVQHGTFTISNLGMYGIQQFRAIINPPESAILAVGAVVRKPVVINERDEVAVRPMLAVTLSADHRVVDGIVAARFLQDLVQAIEMPEALLY